MIQENFPNFSVHKYNFFGTQTYSFFKYIMYGYFYFAKVQLNSCNSDCMTCKDWNIYYVTLYIKSLLTPYLTYYLAIQFHHSVHSSKYTRHFQMLVLDT